MTEADTIAAEMQRAKDAEAAAISALSKRSGPNISIINASTVVKDAEAEACVAALQIQMTRDFLPAWGLDATLDFVPTGENTPAGHWQLVLLDNSDVQSALGYHDWTAEGLPIGKCFCKTDLDAGLSWTSTASHELLELRADPDLVRCVMIDNRLYALEVCDSPEEDPFAYQINSVLVSDFVFPSWFEPSWAPGSTQFDYGKHIDAPLKLLAGGYIGYLDITSSNGWQQLTADLKPNKKARAPVGSRRERRRIPRNQWIRSTRS